VKRNFLWRVTLKVPDPSLFSLLQTLPSYSQKIQNTTTRGDGRHYLNWSLSLK
jgi:hypothetical protein